mmetsp:Transcript_34071/g.83512  ORF Transcript_34071/g.83512 Transcript_34071/m.83512 type:complete len:385 (+) Transcript_34071:313-1467(+)
MGYHNMKISGLELGFLDPVCDAGGVVALGGGEAPRQVLGVTLVTLDDLHHILVLQRVLHPHPLPHVLGARAPHLRVLELLGQCRADLVAELLHAAPPAVVGQHHRLHKVRFVPRLLSVHPHQPHGVPHAAQQGLVPELEEAADAHAVRPLAEAVHLLDGQHVHLVVHVQAPDVLAVPLQRVDQLVHRAVLPEQQLAVVDLVLRQHLEDGALGHLGQPARHRVVDLGAALVLGLDVDARRGLVQPQPHRLQLPRQNLLVRVLRVGGFTLGGVQDHQNQVAGLGHRDHLPPAAFALGGALDDPGQVQQLDLGAAVPDHAGHARQRGELVRGHLGEGAGELVEERGLAHGGEAHQAHAAVASLGHVEPLPLGPALARGLDQLPPQLG